MSDRPDVASSASTDLSAVSNTLPALPIMPLGRYRHYKGGEYEVIGVAYHSETLEPMVVYRPLYNASGLWVRPYAMFTESVTEGEQSLPRFEHIRDRDGADPTRP